MCWNFYTACAQSVPWSTYFWLVLIVLCNSKVTGSFRRPRSKSEDRSSNNKSSSGGRRSAGAITSGLQTNLNRSSVLIGTTSPSKSGGIASSSGPDGLSGGVGGLRSNGETAAVSSGGIISEDSGNSSLNTSTTDSRRSRRPPLHSAGCGSPLSAKSHDELLSPSNLGRLSYNIFSLYTYLYICTNSYSQ